LDLCTQAITLDNSFTPAYALAARCYIQKTVQGWLVSSEKDIGLQLVEQGLSTDRHDAFMLATAGHCYAFLAHDLAGALPLVDEAVVLNPNFAWAFLHSGVVRTFWGDIATARDHLNRALRLSPRDLRAYGMLASLSLTYQLEGRYEDAYPYAKRALQQNPNYIPASAGVACCAAMLGRSLEAEQAVKKIHALDPSYSITSIKRRYPIRVSEQFERVFEGLRRAGVPD
jgi:tetratricopeptide (TPR) repeat protein